MLVLEWWIYPLLLAVGVIAGLVDSVAGGGGIISLPVLLSIGFPPQLALGTNKLQGSFGSCSAAWHYSRSGLVEVRTCGLGILATFVGALIGAQTVQLIEPKALQGVIPWLLAVVVVYMVIRPSAGQADHPPRMGTKIFFVVFGLLLGFYDGFLGPGAGSFWTMFLIAVMGFNFLKATAMTKVMNATSNLAALALFLNHGSVAFGAGLAMGGGQLIGARLGTRLAITRGVRFIRPIFLTMVVILIGRLLYVQFAPLLTMKR